MDFRELVRDYLDDASRHLAAFDGALMAMEREGFDAEVIRDTLGSLHTLKGNSGMMGFESLKTFVHQVEEVLKRTIEGKCELQGVMDVLLDSSNVIREALVDIEKDPAAGPDISRGMENLRKALAAGSFQSNDAASLGSYMGVRTDIIKVDFKKLDNLLDLVGELVIFKTRLGQIEGRIRPALSSKSLMRELAEGIGLVGRTVSELQEGIMGVRMLPVESVFAKFTRMVRDIARSQGKQVDVFVEGGGTELDKTVIDEIGEPILHIVKNAIDHGVETPQDRTRKGKAPTGTIRLSAAQESNYVVISVSDDGRGIDVERLRLKAVEKGLIRPEDTPGREDLMSLIFTPGFSLMEGVTEISGRGVGLDVVSRNVSRLNGQIKVESSLDEGSVFTIKLPLSLAIIHALMVECSKELFAVPLSAVEESVKVKEAEIHMINNRETVRLRGRVLPVVRLGGFFGLNGGRKKTFYLVVVGKAEKRVAIAVEKLGGQQEIVIKPLDDMLGKSKGIAGASILGDGKIVLILDVMAFFEKDSFASPAVGHAPSVMGGA